MIKDFSLKLYHKSFLITTIFFFTHQNLCQPLSICLYNAIISVTIIYTRKVELDADT